MIAILSDLHLGLSAAPVPSSLVAALAGAQEVILNGDAAEVASTAMRARAEDLLADLHMRLARAGATVVRIEGNHDPGTGELLAVRAAGAVLVTHGHALHPAISPWSSHADAVAAEFRRAHLAASDRTEPERTLVAARAAAQLERSLEQAVAPMTALRRMAMRPWSVPVVIGYWRMFPELATRFLERTAEAGDAGRGLPRIIVCGHSHRPGAWFVRGRLVLNTGSFTFPGQPHVVTVDAEEIAIAPLVRVGGEWRQDAVARRCWRIADVARATADESTRVS